MNQPPEDIGPSRVQGCLFGAVGLFVLLLVILLVVAFLRFEEFTGDSETTVSMIETPTLVIAAPGSNASSPLDSLVA